MGAVKRIKNGEWEKNRRDRLNLTFSELSKLLPDCDPTLTMPKIEILNKSIVYIKELQEKCLNLLKSQGSDPLKSEMFSLKQQITELRLRNHQLADLLRKAKITIPKPSPSLLIEPFTPPRKWAGKFAQSVEKPDADKKKEAVVVKKTISKPTGQKTNSKIKVINKTKKKLKLTVGKSSPQNKHKIKHNPVTSEITPLCEIKSSQLNAVKTKNLTCPIIPLVLSQPRSNLVTVTQSNVQTAPIMATGIQPVLQRNHTLNTLGPGTLIMSDGRIMPMPALPPVQPTTAVILMQNIAPLPPSINMTLPNRNLKRPIKPKQRDTTKTTFVNKVPIPAITSQRNVISQVINKPVQCTLSIKNINKKKSILKKDIPTQKSDKKVDKNNKQIGNNVPSKDFSSKSTTLNKSDEKLTQFNNLDDKGKTSQNNKTDELSANNTIITKCNELNDHDDSNPNKRKICDQKSQTECAKRKKSENDATQLNNNNNNQEVTSQISDNVTTNHKSDITEKYSINSLCTVEHLKDTESGPTSNITTTNLSNSTNVIEVHIHEEKTHALIENTFERITKKYDTLGTCVTNVDSKEVNSNVEMPIINNDNSTTMSNNNSNENKGNDNSQLVNSQSTQISTEHFTNSNNNFTFHNYDKPNSVDEKKETTKSQTEQIGNLNQISEQHTQETIDNQICSLNNLKDSENKTSEVLKTSTSNNVSENHNDSEKPKNSMIDKGNKTENRLIIPDENAELTNLFPSDPKLHSCTETLFRDTDFRDRNLFMPINHSYMDEVRLSLPHSDFSNDLFSSLHVPSGSQHPESISPTAAFLLAFPLVSTSKTSELIAETENNDSQHATPTTILQIGNIDPPGSELYHQTSLVIENNVTNLQDPLKVTKTVENDKSNSAKQLKGVETFNKFQQLEVSELTRNETFSTNNCKEKKSFPNIRDPNMFMSCNKKKTNTKPYEFSLSSEIGGPQFQEKHLDYPLNNVRHTAMPRTSSINNRSLRDNNATCQKKNQILSDNITNLQNHYTPSSQAYSYNTFSNEFCQQNTINYSATPRSVPEPSKVSQSSNYNSVCWPTTSTTVTTSSLDYTSSYCSYPQKLYTNTTKGISKKETDGDDQGIKEKSSMTSHSLPKFSTNFNFNNSRNSQEFHNYPQTNNSYFKPELKNKKQKSINQRAPVNWMTSPDIRADNLAPLIPDVMFQTQKEMDFNSVSHNVVISTSSNVAPFNISSTSTNNSQTLYPPAHFSGLDLQLDFAPFTEITNSNKPTKTATTGSCNQQNNHYSWSPGKSSIPLLPHIDNHMIPSTLPTLVGDLALGTTTPSGPIDTFRNLSMSTTPFNIENPAKKYEPKVEQKAINNKALEKDNYLNTERRIENRNIPDYCQKTHSHQSTNTTPSFLSVSQLVDPVKSEQNTSRRGGKQSAGNKNSSNIQKRNNINHQCGDKNSPINKNTNIHHDPNICHQLNTVNHRKNDNHTTYQESLTVGFPGVFGNQVGPPPWQNTKTQRNTSHYKGGSYSAESLIADHTAPSNQDQVSELPSFSVANQYAHAPTIVTPNSYASSEFSLQNVQSLEFNQAHNSHQNCFNLSNHSATYSSAPFNPDVDFNMNLDPLYSFNQTSTASLSRNTSCQTSSQSGSKENRTKRSQTKRREEFPPQFSQTTSNYLPIARPKCPLPAISTNPASTTLTNFNLSTIFPEINEKMVVPGANTFHNKHNESSSVRPSIRPDYPVTNINPDLLTQMQHVRTSTNFPSASAANLCPPPTNFRPH